MRMTIREIAKLAKVSPAAVSFVLNGKKGVSEESKARILKVVEENNYRIDQNRKRKKSRKKSMANVLLIKFWESGMLAEENQSFVSTIIDSISSKLHQHNYGLIMHVENESLEKSLQEIDFKSCCATIVIGTELSREAYAALNKIPTPYIMVDNAGLGLVCNSVTVDNSSNVYTALSYLKENGHKEIGYLRSSLDAENLIERSEAFKRWVQVLDFEFVKDAEFYLTPTLEGAYKDMSLALEKECDLPSCLYADNDTIALGAIKALKERGYKIPQDISIVGMDDIPFASVSSPALTTVCAQKEFIGHVAVEQLLALLDDPNYQSVKTYVTGKLIERASVATISS